MMRLRADIIDAEKSFRSEFALKGERVTLRVGRDVAVKERRHSRDWQVLGPIHVVIGVSRRSSERGETQGEALANVLSAGSGDKRRSEKWRSQAGVVVSIGRIGTHDAGGQAFERGVEKAIASAKGAPAWPAENSGEQAVLEIRGVRQAEARREVIVLGGRKGLRNTGIAGKNKSSGSSGVDP